MSKLTVNGATTMSDKKETRKNIAESISKKLQRRATLVSNIERIERCKKQAEGDNYYRAEMSYNGNCSFRVSKEMFLMAADAEIGKFTKELETLDIKLEGINTLMGS